MKKQLISIGLSIIFILSLSLAQAQNEEHGKRHHSFEKGERGMMHGKMLTDDQKEAFKELRIKSMKESKPIKDELRELSAHHQTLMTAEKPNLKAVYASIDKMSVLKTKLAKIKAKSRIEMSSQLTDEQKLKMASMKQMKKHDHKPMNKGRKK